MKPYLYDTPKYRKMNNLVFNLNILNDVLYIK